MEPILAGIETEYGLSVDGRGAQDQVEDSQGFVRSYPNEAFIGWDYRFESPRADLRGFSVSHLQTDPIDSEFDKGKPYGSSQEIRSDRILLNGARFYNDHGHPEYATPERFESLETAREDLLGQSVLLETARTFNSPCKIHKNNTDFHGASYGTHESYLIPRSIGFARLYDAILPLLVCRQILCGSGKVGAETGSQATFQLSQRADFFAEPLNVETLYRRPIFNTRDEPHASSDWIRLHVICGDANMIPTATFRKVALVKIAIQLALIEEAPVWKIKNPVLAFQAISRDESMKFPVQLDGASWTTAYDVLESYLSASEKFLTDADSLLGTEDNTRVLDMLRNSDPQIKSCIDWAAKKDMLQQFMEAEGTDWRDPSLKAFDLEYHNIDPEEGLFYVLDTEQLPAPVGPQRHSRSYARAIALSKFKESIVAASWRSLVFRINNQEVEVELPPNKEYPAELQDAPNVERFVTMLQGVA